MNFEELTRNELIAARAMCDESLLFFTRFWFRVLRGSKFIVNTHHETICNQLKQIEEYGIELLNINIPPRFSKTELAAVNFIARGIGMNPCSNWLYITASDELRAQTSVSIRDIVQHPYFKIMYGVELKKDQNGKNLWRTNKGGGLKTATIFGQITGFGAGQMIDHNKELADFIRTFEGCIVLDDLDKIDDAGQENANNEKVSRVLLNTVLSRKNSSDTPIINIQQRAGCNDTTATFKEFYKDSDKAVFLAMPIISEDGVPLWEWKCNREAIEKLKTNELTSSIFETQYMQNPLPLEGLLLPKNELQFVDMNLIKEENVIYKFAIGDPADKGGDKYAMPFIWVMQIENKIYCYVKKCICNKNGIEANNDKVVELTKALRIEKVFIEANGVGLAAVISINNLISNFCEVKAYNVSIPKETRILSHYEFVKKYFIFDANYESDLDYKQLISDATTYVKEGENKHKKDAIDVLCAAANVIKKMYSEIIYQ